MHLLKGCEPLTVTVSEQRTFDGGYVGFGLFMSFLTNNNKKAFYITNHTIQPPYSLTSSNCSYKVLVQGNLRFVLVFLHRYLWHRLKILHSCILEWCYLSFQKFPSYPVSAYIYNLLVTSITYLLFNIYLLGPGTWSTKICDLMPYLSVLNARKNSDCNSDCWGLLGRVWCNVKVV